MGKAAARRSVVLLALAESDAFGNGFILSRAQRRRA
jgi:hypothetical protein